MTDQIDKNSDNQQKNEADDSISFSNVFCVFGGLFAIFGGFQLAFLHSASENNILQAIANGIGWYCIGKGIFMISLPFKIK